MFIETCSIKDEILHNFPISCLEELLYLSLVYMFVLKAFMKAFILKQHSILTFDEIFWLSILETSEKTILLIWWYLISYVKNLPK